MPLDAWVGFLLALYRKTDGQMCEALHWLVPRFRELERISKSKPMQTSWPRKSQKTSVRRNWFYPKTLRQCRTRLCGSRVYICSHPQRPWAQRIIMPSFISRLHLLVTSSDIALSHCSISFPMYPRTHAHLHLHQRSRFRGRRIKLSLVLIHYTSRRHTRS